MKLTVSLNGNFLCPFQAFVDIAKALSPLPALPMQVFTPVCELTTINDWINLESLGQPTAIRAQALSLQVQALLRAKEVNSLELHVQTDEGWLSRDNLYLFLFLNHSVRVRFVFYVKPEHLQKLKQTLSSVGEASWDIDYQTDWTPTVPCQDVPQTLLEAVGFDFNFENALTLTEAEVQKLIGYAWVCLKAGAPEAGGRVLDDVLARYHLSTPQRETLLMHLLLTRFLAHQYEEVTAKPLPDVLVSLSPADAASLHFIKAYSATLTRNLPVAERHFKACQVHEGMPLTDENSLYRLNLYALFLVLQGREDTALALEMRIKTFIEDHQITITGLNYVNFINIARLYKKAKQFDDALHYYELAYKEISGGGYTVYDQIYYCMNLGAVYEAQGHHENALHFWVNAALHWLACDNPYALSWRPRLILAQEKITDILKPLSVAQADDFLYRKLMQLLTAGGMDVPADKECLYGFTAKKTAVNTAYANRHVMVYSTAASLPSRPDFSPARQRLQAFVSRFLKQTLAMDENHTVLYVDSGQERLDVSADEAFLIAAINGCEACYYRGRRLALSEEKKNALLNEVQVQLTPAIQSIEAKEGGFELKYHRSFLNKRLSDPLAIELIKRLKSREGLYYHQFKANEQLALQGLVEKKVVIFKSVLRQKLEAAAKRPCTEEA
ncbi:tetratricopeptide repeat protein [Legionella taurinensis]|uniref:Tetratricopeptide repeat protein n=1 Tax=Legionella taurinensis TaxID=70611 RepID=A0A3A5L1G4_9GAMM|nr:tetratricopeptide repeat protein [Legionella taurinensis]RJT44203.1 tetratricopeptide repeat protein [Legionella taurinensis]RJT67104.1 tetratricopeptide repeat protein [Legionella taurinensis]STY26405.1 Uncharacterised protein [Legionella taurinensis]